MKTKPTLTPWTVLGLAGLAVMVVVETVTRLAEHWDVSWPSALGIVFLTGLIVGMWGLVMVWCFIQYLRPNGEGGSEL